MKKDERKRKVNKERGRTPAPKGGPEPYAPPSMIAMKRPEPEPRGKKRPSPAEKKRQKMQAAKDKQRRREARARNRQRKARKKQNPKRRRRLFLSFLFLFVVGTALTLSLTVLFPLKTVAVEGNSIYSAEEVTELAALPIDENLLRLNLSPAKERLLALPYVYEVDIHRRLPSGLLIRLTETSPQVIYRSGDIDYLIDEYGRLCLPAREEEVSLPRLLTMPVEEFTQGKSIFGEDKPRSRAYDLLLTEIEAQGLKGKITEIDIRSIYNLRLTYDGRVFVTLGDSADLPVKLETLKTVMDEEIGETVRGRLDVTNPDRAPFEPITG